MVRSFEDAVVLKQGRMSTCASIFMMLVFTVVIFLVSHNHTERHTEALVVAHVFGKNPSAPHGSQSYPDTMASGFVSSVYRRLFHSKGKDGSPKTARSTPHPHHALSPAPSSPSPSSSPPSSPTSPSYPSPPSSPSAPSTPRSGVGPTDPEDRVRSADRENTPSIPDRAERREHPEEEKKQKTPLLASFRRKKKKARPLSCIAARPDSPTAGLQEEDLGLQTPVYRSGTGGAGEEQDKSSPQQRGQKNEQKQQKKKDQQQEQQKQKKPRRPLSCIVQPPSPQLLPSADSHPELAARHAAERDAGQGGPSDVTMTRQQPATSDVPKMSLTQTPKRRPVSCFVGPPPLQPDRSPPPYSRRSHAASRDKVSALLPGHDGYVPFEVGSPPSRGPPSYLEASTRSPNPSSLPPLRLEGRLPGDPVFLPRYTDNCPQPDVRNTDSCPQSDVRYTDNCPQPDVRYTDNCPQPDVRYTDSCLQSDVRYTDSCPQPDVRYTDSCPQPDVRYTDSCPQPDVRYTDSYPQSDVRYTDSCPQSDVRYTDSCPQSDVRNMDSCPQSDVRYTDTCPQPDVRYTDSWQHPEARYSDIAYLSCSPAQLQDPSFSWKRQRSAVYSTEDRQQSGVYPTEDRQQSGVYPTEDSQQSGVYPTENRQQSGVYPTEDRQQSGVYPTENKQQSGVYSTENRQQSGVYSTENRQQSGVYSKEDRQQSGVYSTENRQQSGVYSSENRQSGVYPSQFPRQPPPITPLPLPSLSARGGRCGNFNCFLDPCPYRKPPASSPAFSGGGSYSYDLRAYFPPASSSSSSSFSSTPARRRYAARPQSACFLCEPRPCCVQADCRPRSQGYFPDPCLLPWDDPQVNAGLLQQQLPQPTAATEVPEGERVLQADGSVPRSQPSLSSASMDVEASSPVVPPCRDYSARLPPRPARRTVLAPRPKSTCLLSAESDDASPLSSPALSTRPRRFPMKKYYSADCLDRVDELQSLDFSPPPAKPLSYFTGNTDITTGGQPRETASSDNPEEVFTSVEMLEKVGQPRPARQHLRARPVSCFVGGSSGGVAGGGWGSSADESGYLSNATPAGSGWLGGLSASTGDILELLDADEGGSGSAMAAAADDELMVGLERVSSLRKAWSTCSLLRQDSLQDRSFTVTRRRRQKMKDRRNTHDLRSSSTETDEGVDGVVKDGEEVSAPSSSSPLSDKEGGESATVAGIPLDGKLRHVPGSLDGAVGAAVRRLHSTHMKAWQIRLRRKQMMKKRRSSHRPGSRVETLV